MEIMAKTYTVTAERGSGDVWVLECAELGAVHRLSVLLTLLMRCEK